MTTPEQLRDAARRARADAAELRSFASGLARSHIHELARLSGDGTWLGPTASSFQATVARSRHEVATAIDDLRRHALLRDAEAADLDRAAVHTELLAPPGVTVR